MEEQQTDNKRIREIKGVVCLGLAVFLLLCLFSYHPQDPSFTRFVVDVQTTHNFIGIIGSYIADSLIRLLGVSSFLLPLALLLYSFIYFLRPELNVATSRLLGFLFVALSFAGLMSLFVRDGFIVYGEQLRAGGLTGYLVIRLLLNYFNTAGTYLILFIVFLISLLFTIEFSVVSVTQRLYELATALVNTGKNRFAAFINFVFHGIKIDRSPQPVI